MGATARATMTAPLPNPCTPGRTIKAVLFDLDGTLYDQPRMRRRMARELAAAAMRQPFAMLQTIRGLRAYRHAQESLRGASASASTLARAQLDVASKASGIAADRLAPWVHEWMEDRPLKHMAACRASGMDALLELIAARSAKIGVFSDYPVAAKLRALGLERRCELMLCASDPEVGAFKPDPKGFLVACQRWNLEPSDVLMVGDRLEVDAAGAAAAGMPCVIVTAHPPSTLDRSGILVLESLERLHRVFDSVR